MKPITEYQSLQELFYSQPSPFDEGQGPQLQRELNAAGGFRGLFDTIDDDAHGSNALADRAVLTKLAQLLQCNLEELVWKWLFARKFVVLDRLQEFLQCGYDKLVWMWAKDCISSEHSRRYLDNLPRALYEMSENYRPAEDYIKRCKHPLFRRFRDALPERGIVSGWKEVLAAHLQSPPHLEVTESNINLLLLS